MSRDRQETHQYHQQLSEGHRPSWEELERELTEMQECLLQTAKSNDTMKKLRDVIVWKLENLFGQLSRQGNILLETLSDSEQRKKILFIFLWGRNGLARYEQDRHRTEVAILNSRADCGNSN